MRKRHGRSAVSMGTIAMLMVTAFVVIGCVYLFPKLAGDIDVRVDASQIAVAFDDSLHSIGDSLSQNRAPTVTPATAPPAAISTAFVAGTAQPSSTAEPVVVRTESSVSKLTITAAGSVIIDTPLQKSCTSDAGYSFDGLFDQLANRMDGDINLVTLENTAISTDKLTDVNMPADALASMRKSGINAVCLGFSGALNGGVSGLTATMDAIRAAGMTPYGVYTSAENRAHVTTMDVNGVTVALLSYQNELSSTGKKKTSKEEQAFVIAPATLPTIAQDITNARAAGAQIVVVSLCWGKVNATSPTGTQKKLAQGIAEAGADLILGTHSATVQSSELLSVTRADGSTHQTLCAYSLGNLLTSDRDSRAALSGVLLHIGMTYELSTDTLTFDSLTYTPTYVWRGKENGATAYRVLQSNAQPPSMVEEEQQKVMARCLTLVQDAMKNSPFTELP